MIITLDRQRKTHNGIFGIMEVWAESENVYDKVFTCCAMENLDKAIPYGDYDVNFTESTRFGRLMPHIIVPSRDKAAGGDAGIRIHSANFPKQLEGCIAVGGNFSTNAIEHSGDTFKKLFNIIKDQQDVKIFIWDV